MTRKRFSGMPMAPQTKTRMKCGSWLDSHIVIVWSVACHSARTARPSMGEGASRCCRIRCETTTSDSAKAASASAL